VAIHFGLPRSRFDIYSLGTGRPAGHLSQASGCS